jgi:hypothetical protein
MADIRRYPDKLRAVCDEHGLIERINIGGPEPLPDDEVEYVRADLLRGGAYTAPGGGP